MPASSVAGWAGPGRGEGYSSFDDPVAAQLPGAVTGAATILLVDDEDSVQKLLTYPLEREGYRVIQARSGEEALERFDADQPDLIVLDLMLPRIDGLEVCRRVRAVSAVPIIMLTARDDEVDKVLGLEIGADDYITKPFSIREFRSRVRALLRRAQLSDRPERSETIEHDNLRIDTTRRAVEAHGAAGAAHVRRVRAPAGARGQPGARLLETAAPRGSVGKRRLPRSTHDRRPHPSPAGEDRA